MTGKCIKIGLALASSFALAEDLPLPQQGGLPMPMHEDAEFVKPSAIIKVPTSASAPITVTVPAAKPEPAAVAAPAPAPEPAYVPTMRVPVEQNDEVRELAILERERRLIEEQARHEIAIAYATGNASALKQVILMSGPVDAAVSRAAKPPTVAEGRVALIGLEKDAVVGKNLEHFFGAPMTPDREKELLDAVKTQLAGNGKDKAKSGFQVRIAGWWPDEGVMAVSVMPES